ncbi:hypothetical protein Tsubulata_035642, partial [Turnera subulata]
MITSSLVVSQPSETECILDFQYLLSNYNSSLIEGDWGGFLPKNCSGSAFPGYLYSLGLRANKTGLIYLNASEQSGCLAKMENLEADIFSCGIKKLTSGHGGCSDFSVANVTDTLGDNLKELTENCKLEGSDETSKQLCGSCVKSWQDIGRVHSNSIKPEHSPSSEGSPAVLRFLQIMKTQKAKLNQKSAKDLQLKDSRCPKIPIKEVYFATKNMNEKNIIGEGTAGKVYKGVLSNNQNVAVKHIINDGSVETVVREVTSLSHLRHPNLVALLGYCVREDECFLIYELCPNGNLSQWIFGNPLAPFPDLSWLFVKPTTHEHKILFTTGKDRILSWIQRLEIAIDSARGLWFLHTYSEGCIVHRDIKPTNILLGPNFEAKLSDFGLSKVIDLGQTCISSEVRGTFGYVDPQYQNNHKVNSSGDVYSFGIVLLQILSGRKVINMNLKRPMPLDKMAKSLIKGGSIAEFVDPKLEGEYSAEAFDLTFQLALSCTSLDQQRPTMEQVVLKLEEALNVSTRAKSSTPERTPDRCST